MFKFNIFITSIFKILKYIAFILFISFNIFSIILLTNIIFLFFQGNYTGPGVDTSILNKSNFPKTLIYGTYRVHMTYTRDHKIYGCTVYIIEVLRP